MTDMGWADAAKDLGISENRLRVGVRRDGWAHHRYSPRVVTFTDEDRAEIRATHALSVTETATASLTPQHLALIQQSGGIEQAREQVLAKRRQRRGARDRAA